MGTSNTAYIIPRLGPYSFRVSVGVEKHAACAVQVIHKRYPEIRTVLIAYDDSNTYSKSEQDVYTELLQGGLYGKYGVDLEIFRKYRHPDGIDFHNYATAIVQKNPDLVIISSLPKAGGSLVKALRDKGYKGKILGGNGLNAEGIFSICGEQCYGLHLAHAYHPDAKTDRNKKFRDAASRSQLIPEGARPSQFMAQTFTGIQVIVEALQQLHKEQPLAERMQGRDLSALRTALKDKLLSIPSFKTPLGDIQFVQVDGQGGDIQQDMRDLHIAQMQPGATKGKWRMEFLESCKPGPER